MLLEIIASNIDKYAYCKLKFNINNLYHFQFT